MSFNVLASQEIVQKTMQALSPRGITPYFVETGSEAKQKVLELVEPGSEVITMSSVTLDTISLSQEINESGNYDAVKPKLFGGQVEGNEKARLGSAPQVAVGSVHAVTEEGQVVIASATGSQLPAYVYGAQKVIWVVGTQKIVPNLDQAMQRVEEYVLPLEDERAMQAYNMHSNISKVLLFNTEFTPDRVHLIFVNEVLGY